MMRKRLCGRKALPAILIVVTMVTMTVTYLRATNEDVHQLRFPDFQQRLLLRSKTWAFFEDIFQYTMTKVKYIEDECIGCLKVDYRPIINPANLCVGTSPPDILLLIFSTFGNEAARDAVRKSWGRQARGNKGNIRYVFMLGSNQNPEDQTQLQKESEEHEDILQHDFVECIRNMTIKTVMGLRWVTKHCPNVNYVIKADTDIWLNIQKWQQLFVGPFRELTEDSVFGHCRLHPAVIRTPFHRYSVSMESFNKTRWPSFCRGPAYGMSRQVVKDIVKVSYDVRFVPVEDAYIGLCMQRLGLRVYNPPDLVMNDLVEMRQLLISNPCAVSKSVYVIHRVSPSELRDIWQAMKSC